jgi:Protein of unknown function (DUF3754)
MTDETDVTDLEDSTGSSTEAERDHFIPIRRVDIIEALATHDALPASDREKFRQFCRLIAAIYHHQFFVQLEHLRDDYYYFSPERESAAHLDPETVGHAHDNLVETLVAVLREANFVTISRSEVSDAHTEHHMLRVTVETPMEDFRDVLFFRRGHHVETVEVKKWFGLRKREVEVLVYNHVVLMVMIKPEDRLTSAQKKRLAGAKLRPGSILIKYFQNIARPDLDMLFPNVRVVMSLFDKLFLGVPALAGGLPLLLKLLPTLTVLFVVLGFYLGISGSYEEGEEKKALAALTGIGALGAFMVRQWTKYQRQALKYHKAISDNVYFRNISNNAGVFDYLIGAAEEQETKEALLAYYVLLTAKTPIDRAELEREVERFLWVTFSVEVEFEVDDALAKLEHLSLLRRDGDRLSVLPLERALVVLDRAWAAFFPVPKAALSDHDSSAKTASA